MKHPSLSSRSVLLQVLIAVIIALAGVFPAINSVYAAAPTIYTSGISPTYSGTPIVVDAGILVSDGGNTFTTGKVAISGNFTTLDRLNFTTTNGITGSYSSSSGVLTLSSSTPQAGAAWQAAFRAVTFSTTSSSTLPKTIEFQIGNSLYNPATGHYYEYVSYSGIDWYSARDRAASIINYGISGYPKGMYGLQGYLVTVTSANENSFIQTKLQGNSWMGATDSGHDKIWQWVTGPEAGMTFFYQNGYNATGAEFCGIGPSSTQPAGTYYNWAQNEPNDARSYVGCAGGEDFAHFYSSDGTWNDFSPYNTNISGYAVEYGGMPGDPGLHLSDSVIINFASSTNHAPIITQGSGTTVDMSKNGTPNAFNLTLDATDQDNDTLTWSIYTPAGHGTASASGTGNSKAIGYTPTTGYVGTDSFVIRVIDTKGGFDSYSVNVNIQDTVKASPSISITNIFPEPSIPGQSYSISVLITGTSGTPTGLVTISDGFGATCNFNLSAGAGSCSLASVSAGTKTITAAYSGDSIYNNANKITNHSVVSKTTPTVTITSDTPDPSFVGQSYSVNVTVSGSESPIPTGTVSVNDGIEPGCTVTLINGAGSCTLASASQGVKTITASYSGSDSYYSAGDTESHVVSLRTPTVTISAINPEPSYVGQSYSVEVVVSGAGTIPSGSIAIDDGTGSTCTITLANGSGSCNLVSTSNGTKTISATYGGDTDYTGGSDTESHVVSLRTPTVTISAINPEPSYVGQSYPVEVVVSGAGTIPSGSVAIDDGTGSTCTVTLANGSGSCNLVSASSGTKTISATYGGNSNYGSGSATASHSVIKNVPLVTITSVTPGSTYVGQAYTISVNVSGDGPIPSGVVTVNDGEGTSCEITLSSGNGSCGLSTLTAGNRILTANYNGDTSYAAATDTTSHIVNYYTPVVTISTVTPEPSYVGQSFSVEVTVTGLGPAPTGTVSVNDGSASACTITLDNGTGSCSLVSSSEGDKTLSATYSGNTHYTGGSDTESHDVTLRTPTVTISSVIPEPSYVDQSYSVEVTVSGAGPIPGGSVAIDDGAGAVCSLDLAADGTGSCDLISTTIGIKTLSATYSGNTYYTSGSDTESHDVTLRTPAVAISAVTPEPSFVGQSYAVEVTISGAGAIPGGSVEINDGSGVTCSFDLAADGTGSCSLVSTSSGIKTISATYGGDTHYTGGSAVGIHRVDLRIPTLTITAISPEPSYVGQAYSVAVSIHGDGPTPGGIVSINDGSGASCSVTLDSGTGSCSLVSTSNADKTLSASYSGDSYYEPGSTTSSHSVIQYVPTIAITGTTPDPSLAGSAYSISVNVSGDGPVPSGIVTVDDGEGTTCEITLSSGSGSCNLSTVITGVLTIIANYGGDHYYVSGNDTESHTVNLYTPTVTISSVSPSTSYVGQTYGVVVNVSGAGPTPDGTVSVNDGSGSSCSITLETGIGSCNLASTGSGIKTLSATYSGNSYYETGGTTSSHSVIRYRPTVTFTSDAPDPTFAGQDYSISVNVSGDGPKPSGIVSIDDGNGVICEITLSSGAGSCSLASTSTGPLTLTAAYSGDTFYTTASEITSHTVNHYTPTVTITADTPDPSYVGQEYTVWVSVNGSGPTPDGVASVNDGSGASCDITLANGSGSCNLVTSSSGIKTLSSTYTGNDYYTTGNDTENHTVDLYTPTLTITSITPSPSFVGQIYTIEVSVSGIGPIPGGTISVNDGFGASCSFTLVGGTESCPLVSTSSGLKTLTAVYSGDDYYATSTNTTTHQVNPANVVLTITSDNPDPSGPGEIITMGWSLTTNFPTTNTPSSSALITKDVDKFSSDITPTGTVSITDDLDSATCSASVETGFCELSLSTNGSHTLTATYSGDQNFNSAQDTELHVIDSANPSITGVNSDKDTGDGQIKQKEVTNAQITRVMIQFDEDMYNPAGDSDSQDVTNPDNYELRQNQATNITIDSVTYTNDNGVYQAILNLNGGSFILDGDYVLTVRSNGLKDLLGNPMVTNGLLADYTLQFTIDHTGPKIVNILADNQVLSTSDWVFVSTRQLVITFNEPINDPTGNNDPDDVTNPKNYLFVQEGPDNKFNTVSCSEGLSGDDIQVSIDQVTYNPDLNQATVNFSQLKSGNYQLLVCGTTSIEDKAGNALNSALGQQIRATDTTQIFRFVAQPEELPDTGFAPGHITPLNQNKTNYAPLNGLSLEIPSIQRSMPIVQIPVTDEGWDVSWLWNQAGYLEGTSLPTWDGNSVLVGHVYLSNGLPGPFFGVSELKWGDEIIIHAWGMTYTYQVRSVQKILPDEIDKVMTSVEGSWIYLLTCQGYDEKSNSYDYRILVRAKLAGTN